MTTRQMRLQQTEHKLKVAEMKNKQLHDSNVLLHGLLCALIERHNKILPLTLNKSEVFDEKTGKTLYDGRGINFKPVAEGSDVFVLSLSEDSSRLQ